MASQEEDLKEWLRKERELQKETKRKEREDFAKLSSQAKIERLMKYIEELEQELEDHTLSDVLWQQELEKNIEKRFIAVHDLLRSAEARDDQLGKLASLRSSGPVDMQCPKCGLRTVVRKRSDFNPALEYKLECISCHWSQEFEW
jgi:endogenous inhibitor of DNA gyrase (YacG/DUF329 family)